SSSASARMSRAAPAESTDNWSEGHAAGYVSHVRQCAIGSLAVFCGLGCSAELPEPAPQRLEQEAAAEPEVVTANSEPRVVSHERAWPAQLGDHGKRGSGDHVYSKVRFL